MSFFQNPERPYLQPDSNSMQSGCCKPDWGRTILSTRIISIGNRMDGSVQKDLGNRDAKTERKIGHIDPDKTEHKKTGNAALQGKQIGSGIIRDACAFLKRYGKTAVRLGIAKANPQANHFWKKNGFIVIKEVDREGWTVLVSEKQL